jgi:hypothetical protein
MDGDRDLARRPLVVEDGGDVEEESVDWPGR